MKIREIIVPITKFAEEELDYGNEISSEIKKINIDEEIFLKIYSKGIFTTINNIAGSMVDDHEVESINSLLALQKIKEILNIKINEEKDDKLKDFMIKLINLISYAIENKTGIYFIF